MSTIRDVAAAAEVSTTTVSKVFNAYGGVKEETRERVLSAAKALDYSPNRSAVQLVRGTGDTVGFMMTSLGSPVARDEYLLTVINGVHNRAEALGLHVMMFTSDSILTRKLNYVQFCRANNLMGLILFGLDADDPNIEHLLCSDIPLVFLDIGIQGGKAASVYIDNEAASREMTDRILSLGHRDILFVNGGSAAYVSAARQRGYLQALQNAGVEHSHIVIGDFNREIAYARVKDYIFNHPEITAIFCASDLMAIGAMNACMDLKYRVPEDISLAGFDNLSYCDYLRPQLTTVQQDFFTMGAKAVEVLNLIASGKPVKSQYFIPYKLVLRSSLIKK